eukprot:1137141-Pelagomonas_calceolata.AAC.4
MAGQNNLKKLDSIFYLRQFKNLRLVNLAGNPFCKDHDYRSYVLSHLNYITYLDYRRVAKADVTAAEEHHQRTPGHSPGLISPKKGPQLLPGTAPFVLEFWRSPLFRGGPKGVAASGGKSYRLGNPQSCSQKPLWPTHTTSGSEVCNASITKTFRRPGKVRESPVHAVLSSAQLFNKIDEPDRGSLKQESSIFYAAR